MNALLGCTDLHEMAEKLFFFFYPAHAFAQTVTPIQANIKHTLTLG